MPVWGFSRHEFQALRLWIMSLTCGLSTFSRVGAWLQLPFQLALCSPLLQALEVTVEVQGERRISPGPTRAVGFYLTTLALVPFCFPFLVTYWELCIIDIYIYIYIYLIGTLLYNIFVYIIHSLPFWLPLVPPSRLKNCFEYIYEHIVVSDPFKLTIPFFCLFQTISPLAALSFRLVHQFYIFAPC